MQKLKGISDHGVSNSRLSHDMSSNKNDTQKSFGNRTTICCSASALNDLLLLPRAFEVKLTTTGGMTRGMRCLVMRANSFFGDSDGPLLV